MDHGPGPGQAIHEPGAASGDVEKRDFPELQARGDVGGGSGDGLLGNIGGHHEQIHVFGRPLGGGQRGPGCLHPHLRGNFFRGEDVSKADSRAGPNPLVVCVQKLREVIVAQALLGEERAGAADPKGDEGGRAFFSAFWAHRQSPILREVPRG